MKAQKGVALIRRCSVALGAQRSSDWVQGSSDGSVVRSPPVGQACWSNLGLLRAAMWIFRRICLLSDFNKDFPDDHGNFSRCFLHGLYHQFRRKDERSYYGRGRGREVPRFASLTNKMKATVKKSGQRLQSTWTYTKKHALFYRTFL